jgi:hypothetical protein
LTVVFDQYDEAETDTASSPANAILPDWSACETSGIGIRDTMTRFCWTPTYPGGVDGDFATAAGNPGARRE